MVYGMVYIFIYTNSHSDYLCHTALLLDAAPAWQQCTTKVERCSAISVMCAVWVAAQYQSHACWYSIHDDFASKYDWRSVLNHGTLWRLYRVQHCAAQLRRHASQTGIMRNVPTLTQNDMVRMMLWVTSHKVTVCITMTLTVAVLSSFLMGTTASEYGTAWRQCHNVHVVIPVVVLCTTGSQHALVRRLKLMQSSLSQYNDVKRSKRKMDSYKWCQEDSYTKEIQQVFFMMASCQDETGTLFKMSHRTVINHAVNTMIISTMVMLIMYHCHMVLMLCVPKEALGDVASANIDTHGVNLPLYMVQAQARAINSIASQ